MHQNSMATMHCVSYGGCMCTDWLLLSLHSVDATNPTTDNGSVVYETIQSKTTKI